MPFEILVRISPVTRNFNIPPRAWKSTFYPTRPELAEVSIRRDSCNPPRRDRVPQEPHLRGRTVVTMDREVKRMKHRSIPLVKVRWSA